MVLVKKITIEGVLANLNDYIDVERGPYGMKKASAIKKMNTEYVQYQTLNEKPLKDVDYPLIIQMDWYTKDLKHDPDNISFAKKFILDGLVRNKVLANDGRKQITGFVDNFYVDKVKQRIEVFMYTQS